MPVDFHHLPVKTSINCRGKILDLKGSRIMGILNVTPDSFFDGGKFTTMDAQLARVDKMLHDGADIIDIGGYSTRPGASYISPAEERARILPLIAHIIQAFPGALLSVDTFRSEIAKDAVLAGAAIINDVTAGDGDPYMFETIASLQVPYIIMHKKGSFGDMQADPQYEDVLMEIIQYLSFKIEKLTKMGVNDIIVDPGFGFGKTLTHNFQLLKHLDLFRILGKPVLAGVSRKSMINKVLGTKPENALTGTIVANTLALTGGASLLRVHDVKETVETAKILNYYRETI